MIITIQGTEKSDNRSASVAGILASMAVIKNKKKTLILQCMNKTEHNVENALIGKKIQNEKLDDSFDVGDIENGIDALMIHSVGSKLNDEIFTQCTKHMVESDTKNMFDVAGVSRKNDFEAEFMLRGDENENLLKDASAVYDLIFIVVPSQNLELSKYLTKFADVNIVCIGQRGPEKYTKGKKDILVEVDFEDSSIFNPKAVKKSYGVKSLFGIPHNVAFNDAVATGTLLNFIFKNCTDDKKDINSYFSQNAFMILDAVFGKSTESDVEFDLPDRTPEKREIVVREKISMSEVGQKEKKAGFFKKKTIMILEDKEG